jgi:hypothetical protein
LWGSGYPAQPVIISGGPSVICTISSCKTPEN